MLGNNTIPLLLCYINDMQTQINKSQRWCGKIPSCCCSFLLFLCVILLHLNLLHLFDFIVIVLQLYQCNAAFLGVFKTLYDIFSTNRACKGKSEGGQFLHGYVKNIFYLREALTLVLKIYVADFSKGLLKKCINACRDKCIKIVRKSLGKSVQYITKCWQFYPQFVTSLPPDGLFMSNYIAK